MTSERFGPSVGGRARRQGEDPATAVATLRQAAYMLALAVGGLDTCPRITHMNGVLDVRYQQHLRD